MYMYNFRKLKYSTAIIVLFFSFSLDSFVQDSFAQELDQGQEVVVTANRYETARDKVSGSITVFTREEIERSQEQYVSDLLQQVPGLDVIRNGGQGGNTSIFMRGANSEHTLVILDGIELNNPVNPSRAFNFSDLTLDNVERIEVLRGPQGSLYGSDAIGGVINIISRRARRGVNVGAAVEGGSFDRFAGKAFFEAGGERAHFSLGVSHEDEEGISSADSALGNSEDDGFNNLVFSTRAGVQLGERTHLEGVARFTDSTTEIDNGGGAGQDDSDREIDSEQQFWRVKLDSELIKDRWNVEVGYAVADQEFSDTNDPDFLNRDEFLRSNFEGETTKIDINSKIVAHDSVTVLLGAERTEEEASSFFQSDGVFGPFETTFNPTSVDSDAYYGDITVSAGEVFSVSGGVRVDDHDTFDTETTFRVNPLLNFANIGTRVRGGYGTGFKAPSLFQLFSSSGNIDLEPETSDGWEIGVDKEMFDGILRVGGTYYDQEIEDLITFDPNTFIFNNIDAGDISGFEVYAEIAPSDNFRIRADYTILDAEDRATGEQLIRRADDQLSVSANYRLPNGNTDLGLRVRRTGERNDTDFSNFPAETVVLDSYTLVDILGSYAFNDHVSFFARVENLFDEEYQDVLGFGTYGVSGFGGFKVKLK